MFMIVHGGHSYLSEATMVQICSFLSLPNFCVKIGMVNMQRQPSHCECGLFAVATATELAAGNNPFKFCYRVDAMRNHMINCFHAGQMSLFPRCDRQVNESLI